MENSTRAFVRFVVIALALLVAIALTERLFMIFFYLLLWLIPVRPLPIERITFFAALENLFFPAVALIIILACVDRCYLYLANKVEAARGETGRLRLRLAFAAIGLLVVLAFAFSEYSKHQQRQVIADICVQFSEATTQREFEAAYELLSPNYRQSHSLKEFIESEGIGLGGCSRDGVQVVIRGWRGEANTMQPAFSRMYAVTYFEKIGGQWYLKGETSLSGF